MKTGFSVEHAGRYHRQNLSAGWDQKALQNALVLVVGAGAVGNEVLKNLSLAGVANLLIVDNDRVELSNLSRTVLFRERDIGKYKANVAALSIKNINPQVNAKGVVADIEHDLGIGIVKDATIICGCLDSIHARLVLNRLCRAAGRPWINAGISDTAVEISTFDGRVGPCYECSATEQTLAIAGRKFSCGGLKSLRPDPLMPTNVITASLAGSLVANEVIRYLISPNLNTSTTSIFGTRFYYSMSHQEACSYSLSQRNDCAGHVFYGPTIEISRDSPDISATELLYEIGCQNGEIKLGFQLLVSVRCQNCRKTRIILKRLGKCPVSILDCPECGFQTCSPRIKESVTSLGFGHSMPLSKLGVPSRQILKVVDGEKELYVALGATKSR